MGLIRAPKNGKDESGVALFMVMGAIALLSILVTEFTYLASINQRIAYDSLDQVKAHYLAKSALKLSLLRLKAYGNVKGAISAMMGGAGKGLVPKSVLDKIWSFPFFYPIPTTIPGMTPSDKESIQKFQDASGLEGNFSAVIESESQKYNLNLLVGGLTPKPEPSASPSPGPSQAPPPQNGATAGSGAFDPTQARKSLTDFMGNMLQSKLEADEEFASEYRDLHLDDLMDSIFTWVDNTYEQHGPGRSDAVSYKKAPFYSVNELHMIPLMDDELFNLFAPAFTTIDTAGININTMQEPTLRALIPNLTKEEVADFFKFRDSEEDHNQFKSDEDFFKYALQHFSVFRNDEREINSFKQRLSESKIRLVTEETEFKITVKANVNQSTRLIEAWVTTGAQTPGGATNPNAPKPPAIPGVPPLSGAGPQAPPDPGLRITYMTIK